MAPRAASGWRRTCTCMHVQAGWWERRPRQATNTLHSPLSPPPTAALSLPPTTKQVKYILGLKLPRSDNLQDGLSDIFSNLGGFKWREFCMVSWVA